MLSLVPKPLNMAYNVANQVANHITQAGLRVEGLGQALTARLSRSAPAAGSAAVVGAAALAPASAEAPVAADGAAVLTPAEVEASWAAKGTGVLAPAAAGADRTAVLALADSYQGFPLSKRPATVALLETPQGQFLGRSKFSGEMHPVVKQLVNENLGKFEGRWAEIDAVSQALTAYTKQTGRAVTTIEEAREVLGGSSPIASRSRSGPLPNRLGGVTHLRTTL